MQDIMNIVNCGYNYRMSNIVAGIGRGQLEVLDERIKKKKEIYETYKAELEEIEDIKLNPICSYGNPNYWLSVIELKETSKVKPLDIILELEKDNIESRPIWKPMNLQPFYKKYDFFNSNDTGISVSEDIFNRGLCIPSDTKMTKEEQNRIPKIACMGIAFKPDIDDLRESPAKYISSEIIAKTEAEVFIVEPNIKGHQSFSITSLEHAYQQADIIVWLVRHKDFLNVKPVEGKIELDFCGVRKSL